MPNTTKPPNPDPRMPTTILSSTNLFSRLSLPSIPSSSKICIFSSIILFLSIPICYAEARTPLEFHMKSTNAIRSGSSDQDECKAVKNKPLQAVMERVCELCHDFYSHEIVNMRALCRANCFRSEQFRKCLNFFKPARSSRQMFNFHSSNNDFFME